MEAEIAQLDPAERTEFLEAAGLHEPGLNRLIHAAYPLLGLITYFTSGRPEVRAWPSQPHRRRPTAPGRPSSPRPAVEPGFVNAACRPGEALLNDEREQAVKE